MCGILTVMTTEGLKFNKDRARFLREGILVDTLRGAHSTGVFAAGQESNDTLWFKKPIPGYDFIHVPNYLSMHNNFDKVYYAIAHNRHATKGLVNAVNAHPFEHGDITGVHNGSLTTFRGLAPNINFDTDSEHIIHSLANRGVEDTIQDLDGSFALVWHDKSDHTMHFIRNDERPFHLAFIKGQDTVVGASDKLMLKLLCSRSDLEIEKLYQTKVGREYIFQLEDLKNPTEVDRKLYTPPVVQRFCPGVQQPGPKQQHQGNTTTTGVRTQNYRRAEVLLNQYGLTIGETIKFWIGNFQKYDNSANNTYGQVTGTWDTKPYLNCVVNGVERSIYDAMDNWYYEGRIMAAALMDGNQLTLLLDKNSLVEVPDDEEDTADASPKEAGPTGSIDGDDDDYGSEDALEVVDRILKEDDEPWPRFYIKQGKKIRMQKAISLIRPGCAMCRKKVKLTDFNALTWIEDDPVCPKCSATFI